MTKCSITNCNVEAYSKELCKKHYEHARLFGTLFTRAQRDTLPERLQKKIIKTESGCWLFTGHLRTGYGHMTNKHKAVYVHKYMYEKYKGPIPKGYYVCHTCDIKHCCNPDHLFIGTPQDNSDDCSKKGRQCRGSCRPQSILNETQVLEIRQIKETIDNITNVELGLIYGISPENISAIIHRRKWKHI